MFAKNVAILQNVAEMIDICESMQEELYRPLNLNGMVAMRCAVQRMPSIQ